MRGGGQDHFHHVVLRDQTQLVRLGGGCLHLLRNLTVLNESGGLLERSGEQLNITGSPLTLGDSFWWFGNLV